jgi:hypothetical protein
MTPSPSAALSILLPANLEYDNSLHGSIDSLSSIDIQSDNENDHEVAEKRLSRVGPTTPATVRPLVRPQFSCPDFSMGTVRGMKERMKEIPPVPTVPNLDIQVSRRKTHACETNATPTPHPRKHRENNFTQLESVKREWEESFGKENMTSRKRHGMFFGGMQK